MNNLLIISESYTNGYRPEVLDILSVLSIVAAIFVIISKNPIVSVLFLIGLFLSIASYLLILGINFIGLSYLLVYVGAVSILFLFILMLINIRISELANDTSNTIPLALAIALLFNYPLYQVLPTTLKALNTYIFGPSLNVQDYAYVYGGDYSKSHLNNISFVCSNVWDGALSEATHISSIGNIMYTNYCIWLILTSVILLLAMVGAIVITVKQKY